MLTSFSLPSEVCVKDASPCCPIEKEGLVSVLLHPAPVMSRVGVEAGTDEASGLYQLHYALSPAVDTELERSGFVAQCSADVRRPF